MALRSGIDVFTFWEYTIAEIILTIKAYNESLEYQQRQDAANTYILADLIGSSVGRLFDKKNKMPSIAKVYPNLFTEEQVKPKQDWRKVKEMLMNRAIYTKAITAERETKRGD